MPLPSEFLLLPKNEASNLLVELVRALFQECLTNQENGLDCYLSMRIRHGTLSGQLRAPLELEKLITQRDDSTSSRYKSNKHWVDKLSDAGPSIQNAVDARLENFSMEYDKLVNSIADDLIRVRSPDREKGLFDLRVTTVRLRILASRIRQESPFDAFWDLCVEMFWDAVDECLIKVRDTIDLAVKPAIYESFAKLQSDLSIILQQAPDAELNRAIGTAQTGVQQALDRVKDWFHLSQAVDPPQFTFEEMLEVGLQCVRTIHPSFDPIIDRKVARLPKFADSLTLFSDIFFIALDNIRKHSGLADRPRIWIEAELKGDELRIRIANEVAHDVRSQKRDEKLLTIRNRIESGDYLKSVSSEGGTGLIKIRKILGGDNKRLNDYSFGFDNNGCFSVRFSIRTKEITL